MGTTLSQQLRGATHRAESDERHMAQLEKDLSKAREGRQVAIERAEKADALWANTCAACAALETERDEAQAELAKSIWPGCVFARDHNYRRPCSNHSVEQALVLAEQCADCDHRQQSPDNAEPEDQREGERREDVETHSAIRFALAFERDPRKSIRGTLNWYNHGEGDRRREDRGRATRKDKADEA